MELGDSRRNEGAITMGAAMAANPGISLPTPGNPEILGLGGQQIWSRLSAESTSTATQRRLQHR
ncbi:hypothetical protein DO97_12060 [Neosynechococcus sphagnicola sy1]|uniref:Uncharacterized protein n=1 Tax=Neosynechococcus sphagnicola sy1 TaxID=1497020 RepID=A0A098TJ64_9CYAN|nr:hypothetical protein DO97_12060 [Neosynechococcus sphagnicola sy1]